MIRILLQTASAILVVAALVVLPGCGGSQSPAEKTPAAESGHFEGDGHDHSAEETGHFEGDGHDHGDDAAHEHPTEGPHGGQLIELGEEEYHAELLRDEKTNTVTVHTLDGPAKKSVAVAQPEITLQLLRGGKFIKYSLKAVEGKDASAKGAASEFKIVDKGLTDALRHDEKTQGRLQITIDGKPYTGTIETASITR